MEDERVSFVVGIACAAFAVFIAAIGFSWGYASGENYGRQREYWRIAAKCPAIVKEVPEK